MDIDVDDDLPIAHLLLKNKPCDICGDVGVFEAIITCCECKIARQHLYCMRIFRTEAPQFWYCEECDPKKLVSPNTSLKEHVAEASPQKSSSRKHHDARVSLGPSKKTFATRFNFKEKQVQTGRTKYISCAEAVKLSSGSNNSEYPFKSAFCSGSGSLTNLRQLVVQQSSSQKAKNTVLPAQSIMSPKSSKGVERTNTEKEIKMAKSEVLSKEADVRQHKLETTNTERGVKNHANMEVVSFDAQNTTLTTDVHFAERLCKYIPALHAYWNGSFYLPNGHEKFNDAFKAHPPSRVHIKVYKTLTKMPENIYFKLVPNHEVWEDIFPDYGPDKDDIGLYFFPRFKERSVKCNSIMDFLWSNNLVMKSYVDGVELLVLSSRLLQPHSQKFEGNYFLWGIFRCQNNVKNVSPTTSNTGHNRKGGGGEAADVDIIKNDKGSMARPLSEVKREACDDVPPGFEKISTPRR